jgi:MFS transporter, OFA family, oxalate/formate antiporter
MNRWGRLIAAVLAMVVISNLQYTWTLFVKPMAAATHWKSSELQYVFTILIAVMTWAMPLSGWLIDRVGPRVFTSVAGVLIAVGWGGLGQAHSLTGLYTYAAIAGLGVCFVYCCSIATALKWFTDRRGLASGLIAGGYGSGSAASVLLFRSLIQSHGYASTFLQSGIVMGVLIIVIAQFLEYPPQGYAAAAAAPPKAAVRKHSGHDFNSFEMLRTPQFYFMYLIMLAVGIGGLMASAQVAPIGDNFKIGAVAMGWTLFLNPIGNGGGRFGWGWVSDHLGRERTMFIAFLLQAVSLVCVVTLGRHSDAWFAFSMVMVFLTWGEVYALFPAQLGDMFGSKHAASNYSFLYSTKGLAALLAGGWASLLFEKTGSWDDAFYIAAGLALFAAFGALALLKMPSPKKHPVREANSVGAYEAAAGD